MGRFGSWGLIGGIWLATGLTAFAGEKTIAVSGTVDDRQATVSVNGVAATVREDGTWSANITLTEGQNTIRVSAKDQAGNSGEDSITVTLDTAAPVVTITSPTSGKVFGPE
ncbi:MAG: Ig-like domain-containing protein [Candidatus Omnitrophota bacterium]|nr:Ig-like domain-containing protein [Candidatus Omnitrophota bacterium]